MPSFSISEQPRILVHIVSSRDSKESGHSVGSETSKEEATLTAHPQYLIFVKVTVEMKKPIRPPGEPRWASAAIKEALI